MSKLSKSIKSYVLHRKRNNIELSCRELAAEVTSKFNISVSKSAVNSLVRSAKLSSHVGRKVNKIYRPSGEAENVGFSFLLVANLMLGFSRILAKIIKKTFPAMRLKMETLEAISEAWIMAKALYNVPLRKIEDYYNKDELWFITGRKVNKGLLRQYIGAVNNLQLIKNQLVSELSYLLQDVQSLKFILADGAEFCLDGHLKSIWSKVKIPINFSTTVDIAKSYVNIIVKAEDPLVVFNAFPESVLSEELSDFIFSLDGSLPQKRIRRIELITPQGVIIHEVPYVIPEKRKFIVGIWPWQYKRISELDKNPSEGRFFFEATKEEIHYSQDTINFAQHIHNKQIMLRLISIRGGREKPALQGILTNMEAEEVTAREVAQIYLRHWPNPVGSHRLFLNAVKTPLYAEDFISSEKLLKIAKKLLNVDDADDLFSVLVEICDCFSRREFFPSECFSWSLLKMRELVYRQRGSITRDMAEDIVFNILKIKELQESKIWDTAVIKFNENFFLDWSGRRLMCISHPV